MDPARYAALFASESRDHLATSTRLLLAWERAPDVPPIDDLFRAFHTIKGMAAAMGYDPVTETAHALETLLDSVREGAAAADAILLQQLFDGVQALGEQIADATGDQRFAALTATVPAASGAIAPVRVARQRLDRLGRLAAELDVATHRLIRYAERSADDGLEERTSVVRRVASAMADEVAGARLTPVADLFARLPLAVRDAAHDLGREARLETAGDAVEADRAVLEALAEPLVHLVRNAVGHGIEAPAVRAAAGKPPEGVVRVSAVRDRGGLVLTVQDDGAGVDRAAVRARAEREGLADAGAVLTDDDALLAMLARPGFTTATATTRTAGRGVGVDAVLVAVRRLRGTVQIESLAGRGTTWRLRVPVGVASVRALLARVGRVTVAVPFTGVREAVRITGEADAYTDVRGRRLAVRSLRVLLGEGEGPATGRRPAVVVVGARGELALVVDALLGQQEILVEAFAAPRGVPAWVEGAAVLADGATALVLAPGALT
jgi:two-component system chemotaxis sensor kinase CheA